MTGETALVGLKILIVEDAFIVAVDLCDQLESCGCKVIGPASRLRPALQIIREEALDGAFLDVNLAGELSFPLAAELDARNVPYVFLTGYDSPSMFPREYQDAPRLAKPFGHADIVAALANQIEKRRRHAGDRVLN